MNVFLDTNVLMDVLANRANHYADSAAVWSRVAGGQMAGWISAISFNNAYYLTRKASGAANALSAVQSLRTSFQVVPLDVAILDQSIGSGIGDFEDAIQYFSALAAGADYLVTRNKQDFPQSKLPVVTPGELLALTAAKGQSP